TARGDGVAGIKRRRRDPSSDDVRDLATTLGRDRLNEDLESSIRIDSFQGLNTKSEASWHRPFSPSLNFYDHANTITRRIIDQSTSGKLHSRNAKESWELLEDLALYDNKSLNDLMDFSKSVKAIALPQDVPSTSDRRLIELDNKFQHLMEAYLAPTQPTQVNIITTSCKICSGPHDTQYCMEDPEQAFVEYASSHTDKVGGKWYTFKPGQNNLGDTYNPSWRSHPNLRLTKFEADFKQQQSEMTNKINTMLKAITDQIVGALPIDTVKNPKLSTSPVLSTRSYLTMDPQCLTHFYGSINTAMIHSEKQSNSYDEKAN
nr:MAK10-like protein [Tanacetum cinerariifolium]